MARLHALIVFEDRPESRWLRPLRPGFRHCFCLLRQPQGWLLLDSRTRTLDIRQIPPCGADSLVRAFVELGAHVVGLAAGAPSSRRMPPQPFSCVELVKRAIGCAHPAILSPFQLYRHLRSHPRRLLLAHPGRRAVDEGNRI